MKAYFMPGLIHPHARMLQVVSDLRSSLSGLIKHRAIFDPEALVRMQAAPQPVSCEAHLLRIVQFDGDQSVGGYTIVVA
jgi:hypothetical protein